MTVFRCQPPLKGRSLCQGLPGQMMSCLPWMNQWEKQLWVLLHQRLISLPRTVSLFLKVQPCVDHCRWWKQFKRPSGLCFTCIVIMLMHFKGTSFLEMHTCWSEPHLRRLDPLIKLICSNYFSVLFNTAFNVLIFGLVHWLRLFYL